MLPKAKSITKSSKSDTTKSSLGTLRSSASTAPRNKAEGLETSVQFVKGVGPRLGTVFQSRNIYTVRDLLTFFPRAYEDRSRMKKIAELVDGESASIEVEVTGTRRIPLRSRRQMMLEARVRDETGTLLLKWFHAPRGMEDRLKSGQKMTVTGTVKMFLHRPEIVHPEITTVKQDEIGTPHLGRIVPIYTEIEGIPSRTFRKILWEALERYSLLITEDLPQKFQLKHSLPSQGEAIRQLHFPELPSAHESFDPLMQLMEFNSPSHHRLIYEEFLKFEYLVLRQRLKMEKEAALGFGTSNSKEALKDLIATLPFKLTRDQETSIQEICEDLAHTHPMNRLIQGDVGSGKTAVALLTAGVVLAKGSQAALMAPTEILAEQHHKNAEKLFKGKIKTALLTGKSTPAQRRELLQRLGAGEPLLVIGTHALIEEPVQFTSLDYILIDEQHRFGVEQRRILRSKGRRPDPTRPEKLLHPHTLILTATPIPRTLALTAYGDLAVSSIRELPPGRLPVKTKVIQDATSWQSALQSIRSELKQGRQAYFIYPLVNESEAEGFTELKSAVAEAERLQEKVFPEFKVGLMHGKLKADEKSAIMEAFQKNEIQVLVSTTVVEVGVDVPNATIMVIEHSERFGLSQLHQLRGRVGRGGNASFCFLVTHPKNKEFTAQRLDVLERTQDGFKIAEADLEIRGPGEFLGTRQSGGLPFRMAHLVRDREWLLKARDDAMELLREDPELENEANLPLRRYYLREGTLQFERLKTS